MNKRLIYTMLLFGVFCTSCSREEANIFDKSAIERQQEIKEMVSRQLVEAPNGWEMVYFPNAESHGYCILMSFNENKVAHIATQNDAQGLGHLYRQDSCLWDIDFTQGVVLTFNSNSGTFHIFSDPQDDGLGFQGDYEFSIMQPITTNRLKLKGKKTGTYIYMNRIGASLRWEDYFRPVDSYDWVTLCGNDNDHFLFVGYDTVIDMTFKQGVFYYKDTAEHYMGTLFTPTGLHFYETMPNKYGTDALDYVLNADSSRLVCTANDKIYIAPQYVGVSYYLNKLDKEKVRWTINYLDRDKTDATTRAEIQKIIQTAAKNGATISRFAFTQLVNQKQVTPILLIDYTIENKLFQGYLPLVFSSDEKAQTITYSLTSDADLTNISPLAKRLDLTEKLGVQRLVKIFCDTYILKSCISNFNQTQLLLVGSNGKIMQVTADNQAL